MMEVFYGHKDFPNGDHACIMPLTFGRARIVIADNDRHLWWDDGW